jgi:HD superfamily phosphohydrolase
MKEGSAYFVRTFSSSISEFDDACERVGRVVNALYGTEEMQYQKYNQQLGLCDTRSPYEVERYFAVPFKNYSRLTHMINCYGVAMDWCQSSLGRQKLPELYPYLMLSSNAHDIGHAHVSHAIEELGGPNHEEKGRNIILSDRIAPIFESEGFDPKIVADMFCGKMGNYSHMLDNWVDRLTYVTDDSYASGYQDRNYKNMIRYVYFDDSDYFVLDGVNVDLDIRNFLWQRARLVNEIYGGESNRSMTTMYKNCFKQGLDEGAITFDDAMYTVLPQQYHMLSKVKDGRMKVVQSSLSKTYPFYGVLFDAHNENPSDLKAKRKDREWRRSVEVEIERRIGQGTVALIDQANLPKRSKLDFLMEREGERIPAREVLVPDSESAIDLSERLFWVFFDPKTHESHSDESLGKAVLNASGLDMKQVG